MISMPRLFSGRKVNPAVLQATLMRFLQRAWSGKPREQPPQRRKILFESLEPRLLMSADFNPVAPMGSLIHQSSQSGTLDGVDASQPYILSLDAGQTIAVTFRSTDADLQGSLKLYDSGGGLLAEAAAGDPGQMALLDSVTIASAGDYRLDIGNLNLAGDGGDFSADLYLNAAVERESFGGGNDDSPGTAQDIDSSFLDLGNGAFRGAVSGSLQAASGNSAAAELWTPIAISANGRSYNGSLTMLADGAIPGEWSGWTNYGNVWWYGQENGSGSPLYFQYDLGEPVWVEDILLSGDNNDTYQVDWSDDGATWQSLSTIPSWTGGVWWGMDTFSSREGDPQYDGNIDFTPVTARYLRLSSSGGDGMYGVGELQVRGQRASDDSDWYRLSLAAGEYTSIVVAASDPAQAGAFQVELCDAGGNPLAVGDTTIRDFLASADSGYSLRVSGGVAGAYNLVVSRNSAFNTNGTGVLDLGRSGRVLAHQAG